MFAEKISGPQHHTTVAEETDMDSRLHIPCKHIRPVDVKRRPRHRLDPRLSRAFQRLPVTPIVSKRQRGCARPSLKWRYVSCYAGHNSTPARCLKSLGTAAYGDRFV